jgi:hypothetical protein
MLCNAYSWYCSDFAQTLGPQCRFSAPRNRILILTLYILLRDRFSGKEAKVCKRQMDLEFWLLAHWGGSFNRERARVQARCAALHIAARVARNCDQSSCTTEDDAVVSWLYQAEHDAPPSTQNLAQWGWLRATSFSASARVVPSSNSAS